MLASEKSWCHLRWQIYSFWLELYILLCILFWQYCMDTESCVPPIIASRSQNKWGSWQGHYYWQDNTLKCELILQLSWTKDLAMEWKWNYFSRPSLPVRSLCAWHSPLNWIVFRMSVAHTTIWQLANCGDAPTLYVNVYSSRSES